MAVSVIFVFCFWQTRDFFFSARNELINNFRFHVPDKTLFPLSVSAAASFHASAASSTSFRCCSTYELDWKTIFPLMFAIREPIKTFHDLHSIENNAGKTEREIMIYS